MLTASESELSLCCTVMVFYLSRIWYMIYFPQQGGQC